MIIKSVLDNDFYKFSMQYVVFREHSDVMVDYDFKNRSSQFDLTPYIDEINKEIILMDGLMMTADELKYMAGLNLFSDSYIDFLKNYRFDSKNVVLSIIDNELNIHIKGSWLNTILYEVPILAIVNEVWFKNTSSFAELQVDGQKKLDEKIAMIKAEVDIINEETNYNIIDFGTRRRYSSDWQDNVVKNMAHHLPVEFFKGTSNVFLAKKYGVAPIGTMAHEYMQAFQVLGSSGLKHFQKDALDVWSRVYRGRLGIALSDTVGVDKFLEDFDLYFVKLFDGMRHDSGDPFEWGEKFINHYRKFNVNPRHKTMVFSDGLDIPKTLALYRKFSLRAKLVFGVGTNLTNDLGVEPLQVVIKLTAVNGSPVAKLSDSEGKIMCKDKDYLKYLRYVFNISKKIT